MSVSTGHGPLGESVVYPDSYRPDVLFAIARQSGRDALDAQFTFYGADVWTAYEISWLDLKGKPQVACGKFVIAASSDSIVESKSFKLYLNSFNQHRLESKAELEALLISDLSACTGCTVAVQLFTPDEWHALSINGEPLGRCLDGLDVTPQQYHPSAELLRCDDTQKASEQLYSHLLRSRCPVTSQPDWASIIIDYSGPKIDEKALLLYLISFREHDDFHEHCVERIFHDLSQHCRPDSLTVSARYLRRGGLDINPWRSSDPSLILPNHRLLRQ